MTKILCVGDIHARERGPDSVKADYLEDLLGMLEQAANLAKEHDVDATVWSGDVFDFPNPSRTSHYVVMRMMEAARKFDNLYIVNGNHDLNFHRLDSIDRQPIGVLYKSGVAKNLDGWNATTKDGEILPVYGINWQQEWLADETPRLAWEQWREDDFFDRSKSLTVTHCPIYPAKDAKDQLFELVPTEHIAEAMENTGYVYYGHIHEDHGVFEEHGVTFANVGAVSRGSLQEYNTTRQVQVALWDSEEGFTPISLDQMPAEDFFYLEEKNLKKEEQVDLDNFFAAVGSAQLSKTSGENVREYILGRSDIDKPVRAKAVSYLDEV